MSIATVYEAWITHQKNILDKQMQILAVSKQVA